MLTVQSSFSKFVSSVPSFTFSLTIYSSLSFTASRFTSSLMSIFLSFPLFFYKHFLLRTVLSSHRIDFIYTYLGPSSFFHLPSLCPIVGLNGKNYAHYQFSGCCDTSWYEVASFQTSVYAKWVFTHSFTQITSISVHLAKCTAR